MKLKYSLSVLLLGMIFGQALLLELRGEETSEETFTRANTAFASGKYDEAIQDYESLLKRNLFSAAVFFNLGNAYFRDGKMGPAVLNYERALWLDPNDADVRANLQLARRAAGLFEPSIAGWQSIPNLFSLDVWTWLAAWMFMLLCGAGVLRRLRLDTKWSAKPWIVFFALAWVISGASAAFHMSDLDRAVVLTPETPLRVAPLDNSPSIFNLTAGSVVQIQKQRASFFYIHGQDGKKGWVSNQQVQRIVK